MDKQQGESERTGKGLFNRLFSRKNEVTDVEDFERESLLYLVRERMNEKRGRNLRRGFVVLMVLGALYYQGGKFSEKRYKSGSDKIAVVEIEGVIGERKAQADVLIPLIRKAFADEGSRAVVLSITSPGGHPYDAERINAVIDHERSRTGKKVVSIVGGIGASAAYMMAIHTDEIIAGRYSLIGSIGTIVSSWDFHEALEKVGVKQRIYASGKLKSVLNPYIETSDDASEKTQQMVDQMAQVFIADVKAMRGKKLQDEVDYFTGEVWPGEKALEIGLIDRIATIEQWVQAEYGQNVPLVTLSDASEGSVGFSELTASVSDFLNVLTDAGRIFIK